MKLICILFIAAIIFVSGCVFQETENNFTTTSIRESPNESISITEQEPPEAVSLDIETVNCDRNEIFIRNKGNEISYADIELRIDGKQENPGDITWIEHWIFDEDKNKQKLFPSGKIVSAETKTDIIGKEIEILYQGAQDTYQC